MATSAFKSTSRRGAASESKAPPPAAAAAASRRRSHSVSAVSRKNHVASDDKTLTSTDFSNSRDNPLFWATSSPPDKEESGKISGIGNSNSKLSNSLNARNTRSGNGGSINSSEQRGRSVTRCSDQKDGIGRSLSRVRGRSVSRAPYNRAYESEKELDVVPSTIAQSKNGSKRIGNSTSRTTAVRSRVDKSGHAKNAGVRKSQNQATEWSEDDSACSLLMSNFEDGNSIGSISEVEDKNIQAAIEEWNVFQKNNVDTGTASDLADLPSDLVNPESGELISDIRREYALKLEESEERARKLRADLAIEEHRGQELDRLLKEILSTPETSGTQRSRRGRRTSNERKRMSNRLAEQAMAYFDECVSLSTFDSSDFSASEDPSYTSVGATRPVVASALVKGTPSTLSCYDQGSFTDQKQIFGEQVQLPNGCEDSVLTANSSSAGPGSTQLYQFSFADRKPKNGEPEEDIRSCIKNFERGAKKDIDMESTYSYYDAREYSLQGYTESVLIDRMLYKSKIESGGLLLCGGAISCLPFASVL